MGSPLLILNGIWPVYSFALLATPGCMRWWAHAEDEAVSLRSLRSSWRGRHIKQHHNSPDRCSHRGRRGKRTLTPSGRTAEGPQRRGSWAGSHSMWRGGGDGGCRRCPHVGVAWWNYMCFWGVLRSAEWPDHGMCAWRGWREGRAVRVGMWGASV